MHFFPHFPLHVNAIALFGLTLLLGVLSGELIKRISYLPAISGYMLVGFIAGPHVSNIVTSYVLSDMRLFVDISLGLILFDLGRHLNFTWLKHDRGIIKMSIAESLLTFFAVFGVLIFFKQPFIYAALGATIAISTSPAVVMMIASDLSAKGPVTRRTLILTSLNNFIGLSFFILLLPMTQNESFAMNLAHAVYRLFGSVILGIILFFMTSFIAYLIGKRQENQFVLFVGAVIFAIGLADLLNLSSMFVLFTLGVAARNFDYKNLLTEIDFEWIARLFFIVLFVVLGVQLQLNGLWQATWIVLAFLAARTIAKACGIWLFYRSSRLTKQQAFALCLSLVPMAGVAIGMSNIIIDFNPKFGQQLIVVVSAVVAILNIIGPITTQVAFIRSHEAAVENQE